MFIFFRSHVTHEHTTLLKDPARLHAALVKRYFKDSIHEWWDWLISGKMMIEMPPPQAQRRQQGQGQHGQGGGAYGGSGGGGGQGGR